jgi:hypothetical protein
MFDDFDTQVQCEEEFDTSHYLSVGQFFGMVLPLLNEEELQEIADFLENPLKET